MWQHRVRSLQIHHGEELRRVRYRPDELPLVGGLHGGRPMTHEVGVIGDGAWDVDAVD
jgi:hypothetical protein